MPNMDSTSEKMRSEAADDGAIAKTTRAAIAHVGKAGLFLRHQRSTPSVYLPNKARGADVKGSWDRLKAEGRARETLAEDPGRKPDRRRQSWRVVGWAKGGMGQRRGRRGGAAHSWISVRLKPWQLAVAVR